MIEQAVERKRLPVSISAVVFIEDEKGRLLLVQQEADWKKKKWGPPAGGIKAFESLIEAALRETQEETGFKVELVDLIGIYTVPKGENKTSIGFVFRGKIVGGDLKLRNGEIQNIKYFSQEELEELIAKDQLYRPDFNITALKDWKAKKSYPIEVVKLVDS